MTGGTNVDPREVSKFDDPAGDWWDREGDFKPLHDLNPLRADYIAKRLPLVGKRVLDVGCGGGILAEEMARRGARVTGIDAAVNAITSAEAHRAGSGLGIAYRQQTPEEHLHEEGHHRYDAVTCLELLEHVPDPGSLVRACADLTRAGGDVFFSTINRGVRSWLGAIVGAEYVLGLLPRGTHDYHKLVRPSELARWARAAALELEDMSGIAYNPFTGAARLRGSLDVNYIAWMRRR